MVFKYFCY